MYGGPFTHEVDAIRDERNRAAVMNEKPDFDRLFDGVELSDGAKEVIKDIKRPVEEQVFMAHDYTHKPVRNVKNLEEVEKSDEKETPAKAEGKEGSSEGDKAPKEDASSKKLTSERALEEILEGSDKK